MRCAPSLAASAAMLFIRLILVATLLAGAMSWSATAATGPGQQVVAAGPVCDCVLPRESALRIERKARNDLPENADFGPVPAEVDAPAPRTQAAKGIVPIGAPRHQRWLTLRPGPRAPPLSI